MTIVFGCITIMGLLQTEWVNIRGFFGIVLLNQYNKHIKITKLSHAYQFPGFKPSAYVRELPGKSGTVIVVERQ